jgi:hypothetical protein
VEILAVSLSFFIVFFVLAASGQTGGDTFFSNPWLSGSMLLAAGCAVAAGGSGVVAILQQRERSAWVWFAVVLGVLVVLFVAAEIAFPH